MADVFLSYKSERRKAAEHLAKVLEYYGYSVWFDYELVPGQDFARQIERELSGARATVVLFCTRAIGSDWVLNEAARSQELGTLIPVKLEPLTLPLEFARLRVIDLADWDGAPRSRELDYLLLEVAAKVGRAAAANAAALREYESIWRRFGSPTLREFGLGEPIENRRARIAGSNGADLTGATAPPPSSVILEGPAGTFRLAGSGPFRVGRDPSDSNVLLEDPRISANHALLALVGDSLFVVDENSNNGTYVNGVRLSPGVRTLVPDGGVIRFGPTELSVRTGSRPSPTPLVNAGAAQKITAPPPDPRRMVAPAPRTEVAPIRRIAFPPGVRTIRVGRTEDNEVQISHPQVSSHHALLHDEGGTLYIEDVGSVNGTYARGARIPQRQRVQVAWGERVFIGPCPLDLNH